MFFTNEKSRYLRLLVATLCFFCAFFVLSATHDQNAKAKQSMSKVKRKIEKAAKQDQRPSLAEDVSLALKPYVSVAPLVSATMAVIAGIVAINVMSINKRKLRADVTIKIQEWYNKLESERDELNRRPDTTEQQAKDWYRNHTRLLLNEYQYYRAGSIDGKVYSYWRNHNIKRYFDKNNFIKFKSGASFKTMTYRNGLDEWIKSTEFTLYPGFHGEMLRTFHKRNRVQVTNASSRNAQYQSIVGILVVLTVALCYLYPKIRKG